ncbi:MAG: class I SAM-dependent methyltransferase [Thermoplasmata archaeon]|nr:class I SAM-dependent methyltransferase [Thermoplasmata archaeon]
MASTQERGQLEGFVHDGAALNPGGSQVPLSNNLAAERRRYERHRGDHVARYRWVAGKLARARVLDVGCGHGFGALYLERSARSYMGIDVDPGAVEWATRTIGPAVRHAEFQKTPTLPRDGSFDAVVCFEVLEHVADPHRLLDDLRACAAPGAPVFLSTPNGQLSDGRPGWFMSPFHLAEFTARQFEVLIDDTFGPVGDFFVQHRVDGLDWLLPAIRRRLTPAPDPTAAVARTEPTATPPTLRRAHEWFRRIPSPAFLWRTTPLPRPLENGVRYSHLLWSGPRTPV